MIEIHDKPAAGTTIRLHPSDNIVVARTDLPIGARLDPEGMTSRSQVQAGHKIAARPIRKGEPIVKYNVTIGFASAARRWALSSVTARASCDRASRTCGPPERSVSAATRSSPSTGRRKVPAP